MIIDVGIAKLEIVAPEGEITHDASINYHNYRGTWLKRRQIGPATYLVPVNEREEVNISKWMEKSLGEAKYKPAMIYFLNYDQKVTLDPEDLRYFMRYAQAIHNKHKTECAALLLYNPDENDWKFFYPLQVDTSGGAVTYIFPTSNLEDPKIAKYFVNNEENVKLHEKIVADYNQFFDAGYSVAGTIHSHHTMSAYHSAVDDADEMKFDGLHLVVGHIFNGFDFAARWMLQKTEFKLDITDVIDISREDLVRDVESIEVSDWDMNLLRHYTNPTPNLAFWRGNDWEGFEDYRGNSYGHYGYQGSHAGFLRSAEDLVAGRRDGHSLFTSCDSCGKQVKEEEGNRPFAGFCSECGNRFLARNPKSISAMFNYRYANKKPGSYFLEADYIRLYDPDVKEFVWINREEYEKDKSFYSKCIVRELDEIRIEEVEETIEEIQKQEMEQKVRDDLEGDSIVSFLDEVMDPNREI